MDRLPAVVFACLALTGAPLRAQEVLPCGTAIQRHMDAGGVHTYVLAPSADSIVVISVADRSATPGLLRIRAQGDLETCSGSLTVAASPGTTIEVSDCFGDNDIDYTITANVVSGGAANCAPELPCGLVPYVRVWEVAGEVDAYHFYAIAGEEVRLTAGDSGAGAGTVSIQVFNPEGNAVNGSGSCSGSVRFRPRLSGLYTTLITPCVQSRSGRYLIGYAGPLCPAGPEISHFGIARSDGLPVEPVDYDDAGRALYTRVGGSGFTLVIEAKRGADQVDPGLLAFAYDSSDPTVVPDLQVLVSRPLGNGNRQVCAEDPGLRDGIPATEPLLFAPTRAIADAINDFGCHVNDGTGRALGVNNVLDACTVFNDGSSHFVGSDSTTQFCAQIPGVRQFPSGDTIIAARVRNTQGVLGPVREIRLRIETLPTATPTPSRTPTVPATATATFRPISCVGDCNRDSQVTFDEIAESLAICLAGGSLTCDSIDADHSGAVSVDEIVRAVLRAANGCPAGDLKP